MIRGVQVSAIDLHTVSNSRRVNRSFGIQAKILSVVAVLAAVAILAAGVGAFGILSYHDQVAAMSRASERALLGEQMDKAVTAVVMDSRGIYMSADRTEAEKFAVPLLKSLESLKQKTTEWLALAPAGGREQFESAAKQVDEFIRFRTEIVRLSREADLKESRSFGDNDANRSNRSKLNEKLSGLVGESSARISQIGRDLETFYWQTLLKLIGFSLAGVAAGLAMAIWVVRRSVVMPLTGMVAAVGSVAEGNLETEVPGLKRKDEIGSLAHALGTFKEKLIVQREQATQLEELRSSTEAASQKAMLEMCEMLEADLDSAVGEVLSISNDAALRGAHAAADARTIAAEAVTVAAASEQASGNVTSISGAAEQLSATGRNIAARAAETAKFASRAAEEAANASKTVAALNDAASRIGSVISTIAEVAAQTNLLALNATIEAARAGEAGRGFAIVAHEVKALARKTSDAAGDIADRIEKICSATSDSVAVINRIGESVNDINGISATVAAAAEEQEATLREVSRSLQEASSGVSTVAANVTHISARSVEIEHSSNLVSELVNGTNGRVSELRANLVVSLRQSKAGDRRSTDYRRPVSVPARMRCGSVVVDGTVLDLSEGGLRFRADKSDFDMSEGQPASVETRAFGTIASTITAIGKTSIHVQFHNLNDERKSAVCAYLRTVDDADKRLVDAAKEAAGKISAAFEAAIERREISEDQMFDFSYRPIVATDPEQFETSFTAICDRVLPPIQEPVVKLDPRIVFCAAVDLKSFLPTHNAQFSQPQRPNDPVWNAANSRNRRFFKDRAGMSAARTTREFLMQTYDRNMGGGKTVTLKEVDVPIRIHGRHWGGLRLAFKA
jgi:methyl-accepting chemotaxis protein